MRADPRVQPLLEACIKNLREVTSLLVLNGQTNEASRALELVGLTEGLNSLGSISIHPTDHEMGLARAGQKIDAIKAYRSRTGAGLKDAKDAIENTLAGLPLPTQP